MALVEPIDDGRRFRFHLVGTELARNAGLDLTGRHVDEVNPNKAYAAYISDLYSQCALMRGPLYSETRYRAPGGRRSEEHTSELQSLMRSSYAVFCLKKKNSTTHNIEKTPHN